MIERILRHLGLWQVPARTPRAPPSSPAQITLDYSVADEPASSVEHRRDDVKSHPSRPARGGLLFGVLPALQSAKTDFYTTLKEGGRSSDIGLRRRGIGGLLVVFEVAMALVLLIGAGLMLRSFLRLRTVNPGFNTANVLTMQIALPESKYSQGHQRAAFYQQMLQRVVTLPEVQAAGLGTPLPLSGVDSQVPITIEGQPAPVPGEVPLIDNSVVSPDYQALDANRLLSRHYTDLMFRPQVKTTDLRPTPPVENHYAYGWEVGTIAIGQDKKITAVSHTGNVSGCTLTLIERLMEDKHLIVLINNTGITRLHELSYAIVNILYDRPYDPPKRSIVQALAKTLEERGIGPALEQGRELQTNHPDAYYLSEGEVNDLGYRLLGEGRVKEAIKVFEFNVQAYAQSANVYDSLGEAYMAGGHKDLAIKNYKKSLQLNPSNKNAVDVLKKLNAQ